MKSRAASIGTTIPRYPIFQCNNLISSAPTHHTTILIIPPPIPLLDQANLLQSATLLQLRPTPALSSYPDLTPPITLFHEDDDIDRKGGPLWRRWPPQRQIRGQGQPPRWRYPPPPPPPTTKPFTLKMLYSLTTKPLSLKLSDSSDPLPPPPMSPRIMWCGGCLLQLSPARVQILFFHPPLSHHAFYNPPLPLDPPPSLPHNLSIDIPTLLSYTLPFYRHWFQIELRQQSSPPLALWFLWFLFSGMIAPLHSYCFLILAPLF